MTAPIFDRQRECLPREALAQLQLERLQAMLARLKRNVRRYREILGDARVESLDGLEGLPITEARDLVAAFPYGMFALPLREVSRLHSSVGPDGQQLVIGHTHNDLAHWGRLVARQLAAANVTAHDVVQICFAGGIYERALGYMLGAETIESSVIPEGAVHIDYQLAMLQNYRTSVLVTTPSNARDLAQLLAERKIDPQSLSLRSVLLSRPAPDAEREAIRAGFLADVRCSLGVAEILDPGLCVECEEKRLHVNEDHFLVEARDGGLLVTTLCREAMPLLRYRVPMVCEILRDKCPCGRTGAVLKPGARTDGRLSVNEVPIYPAQIAAVLAQTRAAGQPFHLEILERRIVINIEVTAGLIMDMIRAYNELQREIQSEFLSRLGIEAEVRFISPRSGQ